MEKKLQDIKYSDDLLHDLMIKASFQGEWHLGYTMVAVQRFSVNFMVSIATSRGNVKYAATRSGIQFVCDTTQDVGTVRLAFAYLNGYPDAQKMLYHYFTGNGNKLEVDTFRVFNEDPVLKKYVFEKIADQLKQGNRIGSVNVKQQHYGNQNWKNAFGSINVPWTKINSNLEISISDVYDWHPGEARISQCVHEAMARGKNYGAKPFSYHGTKWIIDLHELKKSI